MRGGAVCVLSLYLLYTIGTQVSICTRRLAQDSKSHKSEIRVPPSMLTQPPRDSSTFCHDHWYSAKWS